MSDTLNLLGVQQDALRELLNLIELQGKAIKEHTKALEAVNVTLRLLKEEVFKE